MAKKFIVETSARHVHLTAEAFATLFGEGKELTVKKMLSQPGQFASEERVTIVGPKKSLPNVSILGPFRKANQVELSATDARSIGIVAPIRESGDVAGSGACKIVGPEGEIHGGRCSGVRPLGDRVYPYPHPEAAGAGPKSGGLGRGYYFRKPCAYLTAGGYVGTRFGWRAMSGGLCPGKFCLGAGSRDEHGGRDAPGDRGERAAKREDLHNGRPFRTDCHPLRRLFPGYNDLSARTIFGGIGATARRAPIRFFL